MEDGFFSPTIHLPYNESQNFHFICWLNSKCFKQNFNSKLQIKNTWSKNLLSVILFSFLVALIIFFQSVCWVFAGPDGQPVCVCLNLSVCVLARCCFVPVSPKPATSRWKTNKHTHTSGKLENESRAFSKLNQTSSLVWNYRSSLWPSACQTSSKREACFPSAAASAVWEIAPLESRFSKRKERGAESKRNWWRKWRRPRMKWEKCEAAKIWSCSPVKRRWNHLADKKPRRCALSTLLCCFCAPECVLCVCHVWHLSLLQFLQTFQESFWNLCRGLVCVCVCQLGLFFFL